MRFLHLIDRDPVSERLGRGFTWDDHVYDALLPYLTDDVVDVGANIGGLALRFAQHAKRVICFEPDPDMCAALAANALENGLTNIELICEGAYSHVVHLQPNIIEGEPPSTWCWLPANSGVRAAPAHWTDMDRRVSAIKVDAQGADLHVLQGMATIIDRDRPAIVFEFEHDYADLHGHNWRSYVLWLVRHGYKTRQLEPHGDYLALPNGR